jgi:prepilin-type N-terminal cleavage/methylation domain-containing protein
MKAARASNRAFTLIEIMVVVAIMGIALAMGMPAISNMVHRAPLAQGVRDVMDGCRKARALAILNGKPMDLHIFPQDGRIEVAAAPVDASPSSTSTSAQPIHIAVPDSEQKNSGGFSAQLSDQIRIEMVDVNFIEYKDADMATVRFYPNGTSDEFTMVLNSDTEWRKITLEVVTALAGVEAIK